MTYVANATHIIPTFPHLPVTISTFKISEAPILHQDKQLEEFLTGEEYCHNNWMFSTGTNVEEENALFYMNIDFLEKRLDQLKEGKPKREEKTISNE